MGAKVTSLTPSRVACSPNDTATATGANAVITYPAVPLQVNVIADGIAFSYTTAPTGGGLTIQDGSGNTVFSMPITAAGAGFVPFSVAKCSAAVNTAMIVTLLSGGSGVVGTVSVLNQWTE